MELRNEVEIAAPAARVWHTLGERFMHVGEWAAPITSSCAVGASEPTAGAMRACTIAPFGPMKAGVVRERLVRFDAATMSFEYEAVSGMPRFVARAVNRWTVVRIDEHRSRVCVHATLLLRGPMVLLGCVLRWQFNAAGAKVIEELRHFVETGESHPRKRRRVALPHSGSAVHPSAP